MRVLATEPAASLAAQIAWQCPQCHLVFGSDVDARGTRCCRCGFELVCTNGIWRAVTSVRQRYFERFVREYTSIRASEERGSDQRDYYLGLPFQDTTGKNAWQWKIRGGTFRYFSQRVLPIFERRHAGPLRILDLGAGNGWLSYRLTLRGHDCVAVDLLDNAWDGLGATRHYAGVLSKPFCCVQGEMDRLPFASAQFDLAIYNASLHYSEDYACTLREAVRCVRAGGYVVILDSPFYRREQSGVQMVTERKRQYEQRYGFASDSLRSLEFLTAGRLEDLRGELGGEWHVVKPWHGWRWALRPWAARLQRRREPARFYILWSQTP